MAIDSNYQESLAYFKRVGSPIVAVATALGGPIAIIRISGKDLKFLEPLVGSFPAPQCFKYVSLNSKRRPDIKLDHALVLYFKTPHSFTGEDVIEIQGHGVASLINAIIDEVIDLGGQLAMPGEFSFRAVYHQKITLEEAENLQTALSHDGLGGEWASHLLGLTKNTQSSVAKRLEDCLVAIQSARGRVEAAIDFPEAESEQSADVRAAFNHLFKVKEVIGLLLSSYELFCKSAGESRVAIVGEPNVGKSTLLNLLVGGERALVSELAGTTRDVVEVRLKLPSGRWVRLADTAGIRDFSEEGALEKLEKSGMELGLEAARRSKILIWVQSAASDSSPEFKAQLISKLILTPEFIEIYSHADCVELLSESVRMRSFNFKDPGSGVLHFILKSIDEALLRDEQGVSSDFDLVISRRQGQLLDAALLEVERALLALEGQMPIELVGDNLRESEVLLKRALGQGVGDDYIGQIFTQFCLGK